MRKRAILRLHASRNLKVNIGDLRRVVKLLSHVDLNRIMIYIELDMDELAKHMERGLGLEYKLDSTFTMKSPIKSVGRSKFYFK